MAPHPENQKTEAMKMSDGNILFFTSWSFDEPLTHSYFLPNVKIIRKLVAPGTRIYVQTLEKNYAQMSRERRDQIRSILAEDELIWYPLPYHKFGLKALMIHALSFFRLLTLVWRNNIGVLHAFAPAAGTAALLIYFLSRKRLIIDSWEPHANSMVETGTWTKKSLAYKILLWSEKKQCEHAEMLLAASPAMAEYASQHLAPVRGKILHRPACVDTVKFAPHRLTREKIRSQMHWSDKVVCACVSKLGGLYMREDVFRFFTVASGVFGENFHALLISANSSDEIQSLSRSAGFPLSRLTHLVLPHEEVPAWLTACDFAFNPQMPVPSKRFGTPVKDGEYWSSGLPIALMPDISDDSNIIAEEHAGVIIQSTGVEDMTTALVAMKNMLNREPDIAQRMHQIAKRYRGYQLAEQAYRTIYRS
jgi:glycosyltransferase involved in cell wall biosynthesis